ncbi:hypothetical protein J437_LFUL009626 [Ladona fulva]|uniref:Uncharacterized protein n=1 Tax=Ladona fulva TaxID=123851 RepID=A0A8K0P174_LADFU|nr:hypothetical protein J437_LFUL009626 [Ladona fulva]
MTKPCTELGGCANRFAICSNESICTCDEGYSMRSDAMTCQAATSMIKDRTVAKTAPDTLTMLPPGMKK